MTATIEGITFDAHHPLSIARFWARALEWSLDDRSAKEQDDADPEFAGVEDPSGRILPFGFVRVPEPKTVKNRMHFDLSAGADLEHEVARLEGLGAVRVAQHHESGYVWVVMQDPEGNEFCIGVLEPER